MSCALGKLQLDTGVVNASHARVLGGGPHTGPSPADRARSGSKQHLLTDACGVPLVTLTGDNPHDATQLRPLVDAFPVVRGVRGRPRLHRGYLYADRGYDDDVYRRALRDRGTVRLTARRGAAHGSGPGRTRWVAERSSAWLHQFERLRNRYGVRADPHLGLLQLACALTCYRKPPTSW